MKLKTVVVGDKTYAELDGNGLPVFVHDGGREVGFDAAATSARIGTLNREAQGHREAKEQAEAKLRGYEGIEDPAAALEALRTVGNLKAGDLKTAEQVEEIKRAAQRTAEEQVSQTARQSAARISELEKERDKYQGQLYSEMVGSAFGRSKFISEKTTLPPDMLMSMFQRHFKVEDGQIVPYGSDGNKIYSKVRGGEVADFDEGLEYLVDAYPHKATVLKGKGYSGTGAKPQNGGGQSGERPTISRTAYEALPQSSRAETARTHTITD